MIQKILFTKEECNWIIDYCEKLNITIRDGANADVIRPSDTISYSYYNLILNEETNWIFDKLNNFFNKEMNVKIKKTLDCLHIHKYIKLHKAMREAETRVQEMER
jgi:hypothetical protein